MFIYSGVSDLEKMKEYIKSLTEEEKSELQAKVKDLAVRLSKEVKGKWVRRMYGNSKEKRPQHEI